MSEEVVRTCTLCGRIIVPKQTICACGAVFREEAHSESRDRSGPFDFGALLPLLPLVGALVLLKWLFWPGMLQYSVLPLLKLYGITSIASAALAMLAAERAGRSNWKYTDFQLPGFPALSGLSPASWFAVVLLGLPITFPAFIYVHYAASKPWRPRFALVCSAAFSLLLVLVWFNLANRPPEWSMATTGASVQNLRNPTAQQPPVNSVPAAPVAKPSSNPKPSQSPSNYSASVPTPHPTSESAQSAQVLVGTHTNISPRPADRPSNNHKDNGGQDSPVGDGISILKRPE